MKLKIFVIILLFSGCVGCTKHTDLPGFDEIKWKQDENGCKGIRLGMLNDLKKVKEQIKGLNEKEIVHILGNPDRNELYKRNQKFFIYEIANAPRCTAPTNDSPHVFLSIRFNATKLAKEVMIYQD